MLFIDTYFKEEFVLSGEDRALWWKDSSDFPAGKIEGIGVQLTRQGNGCHVDGRDSHAVRACKLIDLIKSH